MSHDGRTGEKDGYITLFLQALRERKAGVAYGEVGQDDSEIGRQWRENSSLEKLYPLTAERLARLEQWARDCRDQVLYPAAQREDAIGKAAEGLGQTLVAFRLGLNASIEPPRAEED